MNDWKRKELEKPSEEHESYRKAMAVLKRNFEPKRSTEQAESTKRLLATSDEEAAQRRKDLEDPYYWLQLKEKSEADRFVTRQITPDEYSLIEKQRRSVKNSDGCSDRPSVSQHRKTAAVAAFMFTPPAAPDPLKDIKKLEAIKELTLSHIKEKENSLTPTKKKWLTFKRKIRLEKQPERMSYAELQKYWETIK